MKGSDRKDLLTAAGLPESTTLIRKATGEQLRNGLDLYELLQENELVIATPVSDVASLRDVFASRLSFIIKPKVKILGTRKIESRASTPIIVKPVSAPRPIRSGPAIKVIPTELRGSDAELESMGFRREGDAFHGHVADKPGAKYPLKIEKNYAGYMLYVHNPPLYVLQGSHGLCFRAIGQGWYWVHFNGETGYAPGMVRSLQGTFIPPEKRGFWA